MGGWHPWRALRARPDVVYEEADLPDGTLGVTQFDQRRILMARHLLQRERRSVIAHELIHLERGPVPVHLGDREEAEVEAEAARRLISIADLVAALLWSMDENELAEELWVDTKVVRARLDNLTKAERKEIEQRFGCAESAVTAQLDDDGEDVRPTA